MNKKEFEVKLNRVNFVVELVKFLILVVFICLSVVNADRVMELEKELAACRTGENQCSTKK